MESCGQEETQDPKVSLVGGNPIQKERVFQSWFQCHCVLVSVRHYSEFGRRES